MAKTADPAEKLIKLRRSLHRQPELSGNEKYTARTIRSAFEKLKPDKVIQGIGGYGIAFVFNSSLSGPTVLIRCELDALPIDEINTVPYRSKKPGVAHKCGHDGHMVMLFGTAAKIAKNRPKTGRVIFLYQPAEETGQGAALVTADPVFEELKPDHVFALHNIPGFPKNVILIREDAFATASVGVAVRLFGKTSHAGEPEKGINPAKAISRLIDGILSLGGEDHHFKDFVLSTIIHINLGEIAFGTSAGYAELRATLRAYLDEDMENMQSMVVNMIKTIADKEKLKYEYEFVEPFPAIHNDAESVDMIRDAAKENKLRVIEMEAPFRWSEDFSNIINKSKGAMFGLGSGVNTPQLHNPDYDFPDDILETGIKMFCSIIYKILGKL